MEDLLRSLWGFEGDFQKLPPDFSEVAFTIGEKNITYIIFIPDESF